MGSLIRRAALHYKDAPCLTEGDRTLSFREFDEATDRLGNALISKGLQPGDRVGAQCYGRAEGPIAITYLRPEHHDRIGSCGRPFSVVEVAILDDDDKPVPVGERGEIVCHGPQTVAFYLNMPEATAKVFRNGWLHSGDVGVMGEDRCIVHRENDTLKSGGYKVYPREAGDVQMGSPGVLEAAVVGLPDEKWGNRFAVVAGQSRPDVVELESFAPKNLSGVKHPKKILDWPEPHKSSANKILRRRVRDVLVAQAAEMS